MPNITHPALGTRRRSSRAAEIVGSAVGQGFDLGGASHPRQVAFIESVEPRDLGDAQAMFIAAEKLS